MTRCTPLRALAPVLVILALAACGDRPSDRDGLGPRGTALAPPQPGEALPR